MRKTRKRKRNKSLLAYKRRAAIGIGETIDEHKKKKRSHRSQVIQDTHDKVWKRDVVSRCCGLAGVLDEMHEIDSRAKLRGCAPERIFNTRNCIRLCSEQHRYLTEHKAGLICVDPVLRADGPVIFTGQRCQHARVVR